MKFTGANKVKITKDWARVMPLAEMIRPLLVGKRFGSVVSCITLDVVRGRDAYEPVAHLHCLALELESISFAAHLRGDRVSVRSHMDTGLATSAVGSVSKGPLTCLTSVGSDDVYACFRTFFELNLPMFGVTSLLSHVLALAAFAASVGHCSFATELGAFVGIQIRQYWERDWNGEISVSVDDLLHPDGWSRRMLKLVGGGDLDAVIESQARVHGLNELVVHPLKVGEDPQQMFRGVLLGR